MCNLCCTDESLPLRYAPYRSGVSLPPHLSAAPLLLPPLPLPHLSAVPLQLRLQLGKVRPAGRLQPGEGAQEGVGVNGVT